MCTYSHRHKDINTIKNENTLFLKTRKRKKPDSKEAPLCGSIYRFRNGESALVPLEVRGGRILGKGRPKEEQSPFGALAVFFPRPGCCLHRCACLCFVGSTSFLLPPGMETSAQRQLAGSDRLLLALLNFPLLPSELCDLIHFSNEFTLSSTKAHVYPKT